MKHYGLEIPEGSSVKNLTAPSGAAFPALANSAEMYFRTADNLLYYHNGTDWKAIGGTAVQTTVTVDTFTGTGSPSNLDFTLTTAPTNENELLVYVGGVYQEQSTYSVSGTTLTLTESPANGVGIEVTLLPTSISGNTITNSSQTATGGQTTFSVNYTNNNIFVYLNGAKLVDGTDYTASNGTSVILTSGAAADDVVAFEVFSPFLSAYTDHLLLSNIGNNSHDQIDTVISNLGSPVFTNVVQDTTPQLGGDLDVNDFIITSNSTGGGSYGNILIEGASKTAVIDSGGSVSLVGGDAIGSFTSGGAINITGGSTSYPTGTGGQVTIEGGPGSFSGSTSDGGKTFIKGGGVSVSGSTAGYVRIDGGDATNAGIPGDVKIRGGTVGINNTDATRAGNIELTAPAGAGSPHEGGSISLTSGDGGNTSDGGSISITAGAGGSSSGAGGDINLTPGSISNGFPGEVIINGPYPAEAAGIKFMEGTAYGTTSIVVKAPDSIATNRTWLLPSDAPVANEIMITNGSGQLSLTSDITVSTANFGTEFDNGDSGAADTIDWTVNNKQKSRLTDDVTFTFVAPQGATNMMLKLLQDDTGTRLVTWPATVHWSGGVAPTLTTTAGSPAGAVDIIAFYFDGTNYHGSYTLDSR